MSDKLHIESSSTASVIRRPALADLLKLSGRYRVKCIGKNGKLKWSDDIDNLVTTVGKNLMLDTVLAGSSYSVTGPFMGLISSVGWSAVAAADTMASHAGWTEAGSGVNYPLYNGTRKTCVFSAASAGSKALSAALSYTIETTGGTVKGCFIVFGTGALATIGNTAGTLLSAGAFTGGDKIVAVGDTLLISYSLSM